MVSCDGSSDSDLNLSSDSSLDGVIEETKTEVLAKKPCANARKEPLGSYGKVVKKLRSMITTPMASTSYRRLSDSGDFDGSCMRGDATASTAKVGGELAKIFVEQRESDDEISPFKPQALRNSSSDDDSDGSSNEETFSGNGRSSNELGSLDGWDGLDSSDTGTPGDEVAGDEGAEYNGDGFVFPVGTVVVKLFKDPDTGLDRFYRGVVRKVDFSDPNGKPYLIVYEDKEKRPTEAKKMNSIVICGANDCMEFAETNSLMCADHARESRIQTQADERQQRVNARRERRERMEAVAAGNAHDGESDSYSEDEDAAGAEDSSETNSGARKRSAAAKKPTAKRASRTAPKKQRAQKTSKRKKRASPFRFFSPFGSSGSSEASPHPLLSNSDDSDDSSCWNGIVKATIVDPRMCHMQLPDHKCPECSSSTAVGSVHSLEGEVAEVTQRMAMTGIEAVVDASCVEADDGGTFTLDEVLCIDCAVLPGGWGVGSGRTAALAAGHEGTMAMDHYLLASMSLGHLGMRRAPLHRERVQWVLLQMRQEVAVSVYYVYVPATRYYRVATIDEVKKKLLNFVKDFGRSKPQPGMALTDRELIAQNLRELRVEKATLPINAVLSARVARAKWAASNGEDDIEQATVDNAQPGDDVMGVVTNSGRRPANANVEAADSVSTIRDDQSLAGGNSFDLEEEGFGDIGSDNSQDFEYPEGIEVTLVFSDPEMGMVRCLSSEVEEVAQRTAMAGIEAIVAASCAEADDGGTFTLDEERRTAGVEAATFTLDEVICIDCAVLPGSPGGGRVSALAARHEGTVAMEHYLLASMSVGHLRTPQERMQWVLLQMKREVAVSVYYVYVPATELYRVATIEEVTRELLNFVGDLAATMPYHRDDQQLLTDRQLIARNLWNIRVEKATLLINAVLSARVARAKWAASNGEDGDIEQGSGAVPGRGEREFAINTDRVTYLLSRAEDGAYLSDRHCYIRSHLFELFVATPDDVSARPSLSLGQIGLRCAYCVRLKPRDRAIRAICYPSRISRIYQIVADMQQFHFKSCSAIPLKVLEEYKSLKGTRQRGSMSPPFYWDKSARDIGLVDTEHGVQVSEDGMAKLEGQKKSVITGQLARDEVAAKGGKKPAAGIKGPVKKKRAAGKKMRAASQRSGEKWVDESGLGSSDDEEDKFLELQRTRMKNNRPKQVIESSPEESRGGFDEEDEHNVSGDAMNGGSGYDDADSVTDPEVEKKRSGAVPRRSEREFAINTDRVTYLLSRAEDGVYLSDRHCYIRSHHLELFVATPDDVSARPSPSLGQIGLRCAYCVRLKPRDRAKRAMIYPSRISRIHQIVADMQRYHFKSCSAIPLKVLEECKSLKVKGPRGPMSTKGYWDKSARDIGLVDTEHGVQVSEDGMAKLEGQKKSVITGQLARDEVAAKGGKKPAAGIEGPVKKKRAAGKKMRAASQRSGEKWVDESGLGSSDDEEDKFLELQRAHRKKNRPKQVIESSPEESRGGFDEEDEHNVSGDAMNGGSWYDVADSVTDPEMENKGALLCDPEIDAFYNLDPNLDFSPLDEVLSTDRTEGRRRINLGDDERPSSATFVANRQSLDISMSMAPDRADRESNLRLLKCDVGSDGALLMPGTRSILRSSGETDDFGVLDDCSLYSSDGNDREGGEDEARATTGGLWAVLDPDKPSNEKPKPLRIEKSRIDVTHELPHGLGGNDRPSDQLNESEPCHLVMLNKLRRDLAGQNRLAHQSGDDSDEESSDHESDGTESTGEVDDIYSDSVSCSSQKSRNSFWYGNHGDGSSDSSSSGDGDSVRSSTEGRDESSDVNSDNEMDQQDEWRGGQANGDNDEPPNHPDYESVAAYLRRVLGIQYVPSNLNTILEENWPGTYFPDRNREDVLVEAIQAVKAKGHILEDVKEKVFASLADTPRRNDNDRLAADYDLANPRGKWGQLDVNKSGDARDGRAVHETDNEGTLSEVHSSHSSDGPGSPNSARNSSILIASPAGQINEDATYAWAVQQSLWSSGNSLGSLNDANNSSNDGEANHIADSNRESRNSVARGDHGDRLRVELVDEAQTGAMATPCQRAAPSQGGLIAPGPAIDESFPLELAEALYRKADLAERIEGLNIAGAVNLEATCERYESMVCDAKKAETKMLKHIGGDKSVATRSKVIVSLLLECQDLIRQLEIVPPAKINVGRCQDDAKIMTSLKKVERASASSSQSDEYTITCLVETSHCIGIGDSALQRLTDRATELNREKQRRISKLLGIKDAIAALWKMLRISPEEQQAFTASVRGLGLDTIRKSEAEMKRLKERESVVIGYFVREQREMIRELWDKTHSSAAERATFDEYYRIEDEHLLTSDVLQKHEDYVAALQANLEKRQPILDWIAKREAIIKERNELDILQKDSDRFTARGLTTQLMKEEDMSQRVNNKLPRITTMLERTLEKWYAENKPKSEEGEIVDPDLGHFMYQGAPYLQTMKSQEEEWMRRKEQSKQERQDRATAMKSGFNRSASTARSQGSRVQSGSNLKGGRGGSHPYRPGGSSAPRLGSNLRGGRGPLRTVSGSRRHNARPQGAPKGGVGLGARRNGWNTPK